jgi:lipoprotein-anchoring transpeptidase ErfK/SrfK
VEKWVALWLNSCVRVYTKFKPLHAKRRTRSGFYWTLAAVAALLFAFLLWRAGQPSHQETLPPGTNRPPPRVLINRLAPGTNLHFLLTNPPSRVALPAPSPPTATATHLPPVEPVPPPRYHQEILEAQLGLARRGISSGPLDGVLGPQTQSALRAFQKREDLPDSGKLDAATRSHLKLDAPWATYVVASNDLARLQPVNPSWLGKSRQERLDYETLVELVAEKYQAHPNLVRQLNPEVDWTKVVAGTTLTVPNSVPPPVRSRAAFVRIQLAAKILEAFDAHTNLMAHFPCSIARRVEKRPVGELHVVAVAPHPNYRFDPAVFPESAEARALGRVLIIPAGPNNPVGTAWIGLDKPGYGIHGTPRPEEIGRTESHGCFRLANWNAEYLMQLVTLGTPVIVEP